MSIGNIFSGFRIPYPDYKHGFWGQQTSTLNFCEEDYALSFYCAELCNTVTNALFIWLGVRGIQSCVQHGHASVFLLAFVGYIIVGLGSVSFHATLKCEREYFLSDPEDPQVAYDLTKGEDPMQLVDELSMIYTTCLMMYASFSFARSKKFSVLLGLGLLALAASITLYYHVTKDPIFHQIAYAALTAIVLFRSIWVMESQLRPALRNRDPVQSAEVLRTMWVMIATGLTVFLGGFAIWNLDNIFCAEVRRVRRSIGLPWAVLLEGHAWWHLMTGFAYFYITWGIWLRHCLDGHDDEYYMHWPRLITSIPELRRVNANKLKTL